MPTKIQTARRKAFEHQRGDCFYCGVAMWLTTPFELLGCTSERSGYARLRCTAEHLVPQCEGGSDMSDNIVAACAHCNHTRHKRKRPPPPAAYRAEVMRRVQRGSWHQSWVRQRGLLRHGK